MANLFRTDLQFDWKVSTVTIVSTLVLLVDRYQKLTEHKWLDRTILYLVIPMLIILLFFHENPKEYGFTLGDWKAGLALTTLAIALIAPVLWFVAHGDPTMTKYYAGQVDGLPWNTFLDLLGWEFLFRGWVLFAYVRKFGPDGLWLHAVPFALAHIGKPAVETYSTIFGGFVFGWVAYRTKSFFWAFVIHWFVNSFVIIVAAGLLG